MSKRVYLAVILSAISWGTFAETSTLGKAEVKSIVVFGDSLSDNGNTTKLLKSLRQVDDPSFIVSPLKKYVFRKMDDFADDYYVPTIVLMAGKKLAREFFDVELAPFLASMVAVIKTVPIVPEYPYWNYHFSDGMTWNEELARQIGLNLKNPDEYYNNAYGGSWASSYDHQLTSWNLIRHPVLSIKNLVQGKLIPPSLGLEVTAYLLNFGKADPEKSYFIFAGSNDYMNMLRFEDNYNPDNMSKYVDYIVDGVLYSTERLIKAGAKKIVLFGVPNIGLAPLYNKSLDGEVITKACFLHNERIQTKLAKLRNKYPKIKFTFIDAEKVFSKLFKNASTFGITNVNDACINVSVPNFAFTNKAPSHKAFGSNYVLEFSQYLKVPNGIGGFSNNFHTCINPSKYAFWDEVHPTKKVHSALSTEVCNIMKTDGYQVECFASRLN